MNKFWGRSDDNRIYKFSRDNEQLLSLNYENLCDSDYLSRLFSEEATVDNSSHQLCTSADSSTSKTPESWDINPDTAEDVILFGDEENLGLDFMRRRLSKDIISLSKYQDALAMLVYKQVDVFEHVSKIVLQRMQSPKAEINTRVTPQKEQTSVGSSLSTFVSGSLLCTFQQVEKQSRKGWRPSAMEQLLQLVLHAIGSINANADMKKSAGTVSKDNMHQGITSQAIEYLRASLCNGLIFSFQFDGSCWREQEVAIRLALNSSYGFLLLGMFSNNCEDIMLAISHILLLSMQVEEWQSRAAQSGETAAQETASQVPTTDNPKKQRLTKAKVGEILVGKSSQSPMQINNKSVAAKFVPGSNNNLVGVSSPEGRESMDSSKAMPFYQPANSNAMNGNNVNSWDKRSQTVSVNAKLSSLEGKLDKEPKVRINLLKPKTNILGRVGVISSMQPTTVLYAGTDDGVSRGGFPNPKMVKEMQLTKPKPQSMPQQSLPTTITAAAAIVDVQAATKNLFLVPRTFVSFFHDLLAASHAQRQQLPLTHKLAVVSDHASSTKSTAVPSDKRSPPTYVWSCGQNSYGELGHGDVVQRRVFTKISHFDSQTVVSIGAGNEHSAFVTSEGKLIVAGYNDNGQCGTGTTQQVRLLTQIESLEGEEIASVHIYNGCEHTLALTRDGRLYSFGYNYKGQLGNGTCNNSDSIPRAIKNLLSKRVVSAACSYHHSFVLCSDGSVYSFGRNEFGQLGHGDFVDKKSPQLVTSAPRDIRSVSCGQYHTICATASGEALACGKNDYGQLGFDSAENIKVFTRIVGALNILGDGVVQVTCGYFHTLLLLHNGSVIGFGRNDYGQLGLGHTQPKVSSCHIISSLNDKNVVSIAAGCYHSIAVTSNGMLYMFGRNNHGQLGSGDLEEYHYPHPVDNFVGKRIVSVAGGFYHTLVLTTESLGESLDPEVKKPVLARPDNESTIPILELLEKNIWAAQNNNIKISRVGSENNPRAEDPKTAAVPGNGLSRNTSQQRPPGKKFNDNDAASPGDNNQTSGSEHEESAPLVDSIDNATKVGAVSAGAKSTLGAFSLLAKSKLPLHDMWKSLLDYVLVLFDRDDILGKQLNAVDRGSKSFSWANKSPLELRITMSWICRVLRTASALFELSRDCVFGKNSESQFKSDYITENSSIKLSRVAISVVESVFRTYGEFLSQICSLRELSDNMEESIQLNISRSPRHPVEIIQDIHQASSTIFQNASTSCAFVDGQKDVFDLKDVVSADDQEQLQISIASVRNEILFVFLFAGSSNNDSNIKLRDQFAILSQQASNTIATHYERLFSGLSSRSQILEILSKAVIGSEMFDQGNRQSTTPTSLLALVAAKFSVSLPLDRCLKLFTRLCFKYREMQVVLKLFQQSSYYGLIIFKHILDAFNQLSLLNLAGKFQQCVDITSGDVYRSAGSLEHCCSNFVKCAIPIVFSAIADNSEQSKLVAVFGKRIIKETFQSAEKVLEMVSQLNVDHSGSVFAHGTVIPSILPSILLYGIHNSRATCFVPEMLPLVQSLVKKLHGYVLAVASSGSGQFSSKIHDSPGISGLSTPTKPPSFAANPPSGKLTSERKTVRNLINNIGGHLSAAVNLGSPTIALTSSPAFTNGVIDTVELETGNEEFIWKKDYLQVSWWARILKICTILNAKLAASFLLGTNNSSGRKEEMSVSLSSRISSLCQHRLWSTMSIPSNLDCISSIQFDAAPSLECLLNLSGQTTCDSLSSTIITTCKALRMRQIKTDNVYRALFSLPKTPSSGSSSGRPVPPSKISLHYESMEAMIMSCVQHAIGNNALEMWMTHMDSKREAGSIATSRKSRLKEVWEAVANFSKSLVRSRSQLMASAGDNTWEVVVSNIMTACSRVRALLMVCVPHVDKNNAIMVFSRSDTFTHAKNSFRRAMLLIICCNRWKSCTNARAGQLGITVVNYFVTTVDFLTDQYRNTSMRDMNGRWENLLRNMHEKCDEIGKFNHSLTMFSELLRDNPIPAMKTEVIIELSKSLKQRIDFESKSSENSAFCCDIPTLMEARRVLTQLLMRIHQIPKEFLACYKQGLSQASTSEIVLLTVAIKFLRMFCGLTIPSLVGGCISSSFTIFSREICGARWGAFSSDLRSLFVLLDDKTSDFGALCLSEEKIPAARRLPSRDRNKILRRACNSLIYFIQELVMNETASGINCRSHVTHKLMLLHCELFASLQRTRMNLSRNSSDLDGSAGFRLNAMDSDSSPVSLLGSSASKLAIKDASKRRCQDLISKAVEFSRVQEGFVVQGDKLLNNYKGTDFTLATWICVKKKPTSKSSFISGKVSHNDAWPLIVMRNDAKLVLYYGHGNEFDMLISQNPVPIGQWTHIAVVVEAKKIKIFINGSPDAQALTKGNTRAILYPIVVGACPQGVRTRIDQVKEGFDGMLSQYKYYTRALSPIHIRVIFDQGPPDSFDIQERWLYQLLGSFKLLVNRFVDMRATMTTNNMESGAQHLVAQVVEALHMLFVTDSNGRVRIVSLQLLTQLFGAYDCYNVSLSSPLGYILPGAFCASIVPANSGVLQAATCASALFLATHQSCIERLALYFIRLIGICWSPQVLAITDDMIAEGTDFIAILQQQTRSTRLMQQHTSESDVEFAIVREFLDYVPGCISFKCVRNEMSLVTPPSSPVCAEASREDQMNEIFYHVVVALRVLSRKPAWCTAISNVIAGIFARASDVTESAIRLNDSADRGGPLLKTSATASRLFGRNGAWSLLTTAETLGASILLGEKWAGPCVGADVGSYFGTHPGRILHVNKASSLVSLLSWNNARSQRQLSVVRIADTDSLRIPHTLELDLIVAIPAIMRFFQSLEGFASLALTDHLSVYKPDHGFQRQSMLRILRPLEIFLFQKILAYFANENVAMDKGFLLETPTMFKFLLNAAVHAVRLPMSQDEEDSLSPKVLHALWPRSARCILSLVGKISLCEYPPQESERSLIDFLSKGLGIAVDSFQHTGIEKYLKAGMFSELVFNGIQVQESPGRGLDGEYLSNNNNASHDQESKSRMQYSKPVIAHSNSNEKEIFKFPVNDWLSSAAEGNAINLFGSSLHDIGHEIPANNTLKMLHIIRHDLILACQDILVGSLLNESVYNSLPFSTKLNLYQSLCWCTVSANTPYGSNDLSNSSEYIKPTSSKLRVSVDMMLAVLYRDHREEVTVALASELKFCAISFLQLNSSKLTSGNVLECTNVLTRIYQACQTWLDHHINKPFEDELCCCLLKQLLPSLSFVESSEVELHLMKICRIALHRLIQHFSIGRSIPSKELLALTKSNNSTLLRARAQEQLSRQKGNARYQFSSLVQNLTQLSAGLEIIQRFGNHIHVCSVDPPSAAMVTPSRTSSTQNIGHFPGAMITDKATIVGVRQTSVDADLTACNLSALIVAEYRAAVMGASPDAPVGNIQEFKASTFVNPMVSSSGFKGVSVEVSIGVNVDGEECVYEIVYCGSSFRFMQSGLSPGCGYKLRCRATVTTVSGPIALDWSEPVEFVTDDGIGFTFDPMKCGPDVLLSDDCLTASYAGDDSWSTLLGSKSFTSGITSWKIKVTQSSTAYIFVGVAAGAAELNTFLGGCGQGWGFIGEQALYHNREKVKVYGEPFGGGDVIGVLLDLNAGTLSFSKNGKSLGVAFDKIFGELYPAVAFYNVGQELEIIVDSYNTSCPQEPIPCSLSRLNVDDISILSEFIFSFNTGAPLPIRLLQMVADHCNDWCNAAQIRCRTISGKSIFISKLPPTSQPSGIDLVVGERVRTPYGVAEVVGFAFNRIWFNVNNSGIWFFSYNQMLRGKEKGYFSRCSYQGITAAESAEESAEVASLALATPRPSSARPQSAAAMASSRGGQATQSNYYDATSLQEMLDSNRWCEEMDAALLSFLATKGEDNAVSPWVITPTVVTDEFRTLQQHLSRIVMNSVELSHRWGFAGPKRKAVIARLGLLRLFNHLVDYYLPALLVDVPADATNAMSGPIVDDFQAKLVTVSSNYVESLEDDVISTSDATTESLNSMHELPSNVAINKSWTHVVGSNPDNLCGARKRIFSHLKLVHFWELLNRTATRTLKIDDDYDYPDDLPQIKINRFKSFRAREASQLMGIAGEDLVQASMFYQLWKELRKEIPDKLRICYTHPMDDGQSRAFKIKFDGEGVDDYGGPYREVFQQICDELTRPDPTHAASFDILSETEDDVSSSVVAVGRVADGAHEGIRPVKCFIPILMPTPNWVCGDCEERYKYIFYPGEPSPIRTDLYCFLGQLVGIALRSKITLEIMLVSYIWKCVVREPIAEADIASFDHTGCHYIKQLAAIHARMISGKESEETLVALRTEAEIYIQDQTWTAKRVDGRVVELIPNGAQMTVAFDEIGTYLELYVQSRLTECSPAIEAFRRGILAIIPESALALLSWKELEMLVCGSMSIDIKRLQANTEYDDDISAEDTHIVMFWEVLNELSELEKSSFLRFVWARPTLPPKGVEFPQKFKIQSSAGEDGSLIPDQYFPKAHTCFFSINLPRYSTKKLMAEKLRYAISNCTEMDADYKMTDTDVAGWGLNFG